MLGILLYHCSPVRQGVKSPNDATEGVVERAATADPGRGDIKPDPVPNLVGVVH